MSGKHCGCGHCEPAELEHDHAHDHEHDHGHSHGEGGMDVRGLLCLAASAVLLAAGLLIPLAEPVRIAVLLGAWLVAGWEVLLQAVRNLLRGRVFDEAFLMALAGVGAICIGEYPEAAAVMLFYGVGELFQDLAVRRSRASIRDLLDVRPDRAARLTDGVFVECAAEALVPGDIVQVKPGERLPVDGVVTAGASQVDTSALTGESIPREAAMGDEVLAGCVNLSGVLEVRATKPFGESTAAKVLELAERAGERKAKTERFITRFARIYTPAVVLAAVAIAVIPSLVTGQWSLYLHRALVFLVVSCPCALVVSVPMAFFAGIGCASRSGILVKSGSVLEALAEVDTVAFDKTGTLTSGVFQVQQVFPGALDEAELLELAAHAELLSNHPIAASLRAAYGGAIDPARVSDAEEQAGGGVAATVDGRRVLLGNLRRMDGIPLPDIDCKGNIIYIAVDGNFAGAIEIADQPKPEARGALADLRALGVRRTLLLTGDRQAVGEGLGRAVGIDEVYGGLLPDGKVEILENALNSKDRQGKLLFIGDGMNDAPVLARADVGAAMGGVGSDAAIEAADVVIMDDRLTRLPRAIRISRRTRAIAAQNIALALGIKGAVLLLSAVGFASMWMAVFADVGVSLLAVLNAMRALKLPQE